MQINLVKNSQILDFDKLKWFLPCLLFTLLLSDWKDNKGKEIPYKLVGTRIYRSTDFLDQHWKCLQIRLLILMYVTCNIYIYIYRQAVKKCCLIRNLTYSLDWNTMKKVCPLVLLEYMQIFPAGRQTSTSRSGCVCVCGGGAGGAGVEREYSISHDHTIRAIHGFLIIHQ